MGRPVVTTTNTTSVPWDATNHRVVLSVDGVPYRVVHLETERDPMGNETVRVVGVPKSLLLPGDGVGPAADEGAVERAVAKAVEPLFALLRELAERIDDLAHNLPDG